MPEAHKVVAEPVGDAEVEPPPGALRTEVGGMARDLVQRVERGHELGAGVQLTPRCRLLVCGDLDGTVTDPSSADARLREARDALRRVPRGGRLECFDEALRRVGQQHRLHEALCRLLDEAGWSPGGIAHDYAADRVFEAGVERSDEPQRCRVRDRCVPRGMPKVERAIARELVELCDVRKLAAVVRLVETGAVNPGVRVVAEAFDLRLDERVDLVKASRGTEIDRGEPEPPPGRVAVGVDEPGGDRGTRVTGGEVERALGFETVEVTVEADDAITDDADAPRRRTSRIERENLAR